MAKLKSKVKQKNEFIVTSDAHLELMNTDPYHDFEKNHLALSVFPSGEMIDFVANKNQFFQNCLDNGEGYMDVYLEFNMKKEPYYPEKFLFIASDKDGNTSEEEVKIAKESRQVIMNAVDKQSEKLGFQGIDEIYLNFEILKCNYEIMLNEKDKSNKTIDLPVEKGEIEFMNSGRD